MLRTSLSRIGLVALFALPALAQDPTADLVEAAKQAVTYWRGWFAQCPAPKFSNGAWYTESIEGPDTGTVWQIVYVSLDFNTEAVNDIQRLNGTEFLASSTFHGAAQRMFKPGSGWSPWAEGPSIRVNIVRRNGAWTLHSDQPPRPSGYRVLDCAKVPKG
jgi:hypothetical protein